MRAQGAPAHVGFVQLALMFEVRIPVEVSAPFFFSDGYALDRRVHSAKPIGMIKPFKPF